MQEHCNMGTFLHLYQCYRYYTLPVCRSLRGDFPSHFIRPRRICYKTSAGCGSTKWVGQSFCERLINACTDYTNYIQALQTILQESQALILNLSRGYKTAARVDHEWKEKMKKIIMHVSTYILFYTHDTCERIFPCGKITTIYVTNYG